MSRKCSHADLPCLSITAIRDPEAKRAALLALVLQLPKPHFDTLRYLMMHLNRYAPSYPFMYIYVAPPLTACLLWPFRCSV